jgi:hypothetical protein
MNFDAMQMDLDLATRDLYLQKIQQQIIAKRQMLLNKQKMLRKTSRQNEFLNGVQSDYAKYYNYIVKQKQDQIRSMNIIKQYLTDILVSGKLTKEDIEHAKKEQKNILGEIDNVKGSLDEIMKNTSEMDLSATNNLQAPV